MTYLSRLTAFALISSLAACGGKSFDTGGGGSDAGGSSSQGGGAGRGGASPAGGSASAGSGQGGTGGDSCSSFADDAGLRIEVQITNETSQPLYLGEQQVSCGLFSAFDVRHENGAYLASPSDCRQSCEALANQGPVGCPDLCRLPQAITLLPGGTYSTTFDGLDYVPMNLPPVCVGNPDGIDACDQARRIQPGRFTFSSRAGSELDCSQSANAGTCGTCDADRSAPCTTNGALIGGPIHTAETTVLLDAIFGVYPASGSAPKPSPGNAGAAADPVVQIVFSE